MASQGPAGSFVLNVRVTEPAAISAAVGVYVAVSELLLGLKVPAPPLHVPEDAEPLTEPARVTPALDAQTVWSIPALATAAGFIVMTV
jgi:hypothetical protein